MKKRTIFGFCFHYCLFRYKCEFQRPLFISCGGKVGLVVFPSGDDGCGYGAGGTWNVAAIANENGNDVGTYADGPSHRWVAVHIRPLQGVAGKRKEKRKSDFLAFIKHVEYFCEMWTLGYTSPFP